MREITFREALNEAFSEEMQRDPNVFLIGQDIGFMGGLFGATKGLWERFGEKRVIDAPISEMAMVGSAVGSALMGMRPVLEISFGEFMPSVMEIMANNAAKICYGTNGKTRVPMVLRGAFGVGHSRLHKDHFETWFAHVPGLKVALPATPHDAKGMMKAAIRDNNPVVFFEHEALYEVKGPVPEGEYTVPLGVAEVKLAGDDVTVVAISNMVQDALQVAAELREEGIGVEVVDPRTIAPLDKETILRSVRKTGRLVVAHESWRNAGIGAEISATVAEEALKSLKAPVVRVGGLDVPVPADWRLEALAIPRKPALVQAIRDVLSAA